MANMVAAAAAKATPEIFFAVFIYSTLRLKKVGLRYWYYFYQVYARLESDDFKLVQKILKYLIIKQDYPMVLDLDISKSVL